MVTGGRPLNGSVKIPAAKNSVLPLFAASLLCTGEVRLQAVPRLADVEHCMALLRGVGCAARWEGSDAVLSGPPANSTLPGQTAGQMRASILFCAPLLARLGRAETSLPGGCRIGARPIDLHLAGLAKMGAVELEAGEGRLVLTAPSGLHGAEITLRFPSVGATETLLLAAACARGRTILRGAAREPEIADLAAFLNRCGGCIEGAGTSTLRIEGRRGLSGCCFSPLPDRIFASTLACGCAAAGGRVELTGCAPALYAPVLEILGQMGCRVEPAGDTVRISRFGRGGTGAGGACGPGNHGHYPPGAYRPGICRIYRDFGRFGGANSAGIGPGKQVGEKNLCKKTNLSCNRGKKMIRYSYISIVSNSSCAKSAGLR